MKKVAIFVDHENIRIPAEKMGCDIDWFDLKDYLANDEEGRTPMEGFIYITQDPRWPDKASRLEQQLWEDGWYVIKKPRVPNGENSFKANVDVEIAMDMIAFAMDARPDIIVLVSGDQDFVPAVHKLRQRGIRTEVASFAANVSQWLIDAASGFISLDEYCKTLHDRIEAAGSDSEDKHGCASEVQPPQGNNVLLEQNSAAETMSRIFAEDADDDEVGSSEEGEKKRIDSVPCPDIN